MLKTDNSVRRNDRSLGGVPATMRALPGPMWTGLTHGSFCGACAASTPGRRAATVSAAGSSGPMDREPEPMTDVCGDFDQLLRRSGVGAGALPVEKGEERPPAAAETDGPAHGTTVIAVKFAEGVLNVGDRRATSENFVLYDRADKILPLDDHTLIAISGAYARAMEAVRFLRHSFNYYRRSQLQDMSLEGKLSEVTRFLAGGVADPLRFSGMIIPLISAYDPEAAEGRVFFYDAAGARFETSEFGAAGSGSHRIRGAFDYIVKTKGPFHELSLQDALHEALVLLDIASDLDAATGGFRKVPPTAKLVTEEGIREMIKKIWSRFLPNKTVMVASENEINKISDMIKALPDLTRLNGKPTAYVCSGHICHLPVNEPKMILDLLEKPA